VVVRELVLRALLLVALVLIVSGCESEENQKRQTAQCAMEGWRLFPTDPNGNTGSRAIYVRLCMTAAGYDFTPAENACIFTSEMASAPDCYLPSSSIALFFRNFESSLSRLARS
jgi:hypothetical protein